MSCEDLDLMKLRDRESGGACQGILCQWLSPATSTTISSWWPGQFHECFGPPRPLAPVATALRDSRAPEWLSSRKESAWPQRHMLSMYRSRASGSDARVSPEPLSLGFCVGSVPLNPGTGSSGRYPDLTSTPASWATASQARHPETEWGPSKDNWMVTGSSWVRRLESLCPITDKV